MADQSIRLVGVPIQWQNLETQLKKIQNTLHDSITVNVMTILSEKRKTKKTSVFSRLQEFKQDTPFGGSEIQTFVSKILQTLTFSIVMNAR